MKIDAQLGFRAITWGFGTMLVAFAAINPQALDSFHILVVAFMGVFLVALEFIGSAVYEQREHVDVPYEGEVENTVKKLQVEKEEKEIPAPQEKEAAKPVNKGFAIP